MVPMRDRSGGLGDARRYRPRGMTLREAGEATRSNADPFRPALQVVDGGRRRGTPANGGTTRRSGPAQPGRTGTAGSGTADQDKPARKTAGGKPTGTSRAAKPAGQAGRTAASGATRAAKPAGQSGRTAASGTSRSKPPGRRPAGTRAPRRRLARLGHPMRRLRLGTVIVLVLFTVLGGRLVQLQLTSAKAYAADALAQRLITLEVPAPRGAILDRSGAVLAHSVEARYVYADPSMIDDAAEVADRLTPVLGIARSELIAKMRKQKLSDGQPQRFVYLARGVDIDTGAAVEALNIKGIGVRRDERREQPGHDLAANVIGFTNKELTGLAGLEAGYDEVLRGSNGSRTLELGGNGREIPDGYHKEVAAHPGSSVQLTLDRDLQYQAQQALASRMRSIRADMGAAVVLDVHTGDVLAMVSYPAFDATNPLAYPAASRVDYASQAVVEPGSVHKAVVFGAALQEGVVKPDTTVLVPTSITKGDTTYHDTHWHDQVRMTIPGILAYSSNIGTIEVASKLGPAKLYEYQRKFGLGTATGLGLPGEASGLVQPPSRWSGSSAGSIPIGLGIAVTPLQMAQVYATVANDGVWVQPHLLERTIGPDGRRQAAGAPSEHRVMSAENAGALRQALEAVVTVPDATGTSAQITGYRVAGKTGTGLRVVNNHYQEGNVASFVGMAPADAPRYVVAVFAHSPSGMGGTVAGPVFRDIMSFTLRHYHVPPTGTKPPTFKVYG